MKNILFLHALEKPLYYLIHLIYWLYLSTCSKSKNHLNVINLKANLKNNFENVLLRILKCCGTHTFSLSGQKSLIWTQTNNIDDNKRKLPNKMRQTIMLAYKNGQILSLKNNMGFLFQDVIIKSTNSILQQYYSKKIAPILKVFPIFGVKFYYQRQNKTYTYVDINMKC